MKKQILNLGKSLTKSQQQDIRGGVVPDYCFDNTPGYREECRNVAMIEYMKGGCPTWNNCFAPGPGGTCTDMCKNEAGGRK